MKKIFLLFAVALLMIACNKDDEVPQPIDDLPPATQVGAVMLACKVNGVPYIYKGYSEVTAYYQWVNGGYGFSITGRRPTDFVWYIALGNRGNAPIEEGKAYILNGNDPGYAGTVDILGGSDNYVESSSTTAIYTGEMTITKFDLENEIV